MAPSPRNPRSVSPLVASSGTLAVPSLVPPATPLPNVSKVWQGRLVSVRRHDPAECCPGTSAARLSGRATLPQLPKPRDPERVSGTSLLLPITLPATCTGGQRTVVRSSRRSPCLVARLIALRLPKRVDGVEQLAHLGLPAIFMPDSSITSPAICIKASMFSWESQTTTTRRTSPTSQAVWLRLPAAWRAPCASKRDHDAS
jgi:hypothetical protein